MLQLLPYLLTIDRITILQSASKQNLYGGESCHEIMAILGRNFPNISFLFLLSPVFYLCKETSTRFHLGSGCVAPDPALLRLDYN